MDPKIKSFIEQLYEAFPTLITPEFIETLEKDLESKLLHEQISFLKEEILPVLNNEQSNIMELESISDKSYHENLEQDNNELTQGDTFKQDNYIELETSNHPKLDVQDKQDNYIESETSNHPNLVAQDNQDNYIESDTLNHSKLDVQEELDVDISTEKTSKRQEKPDVKIVGDISKEGENHNDINVLGVPLKENQNFLDTSKEETSDINKENNQEQPLLNGVDLFNYLKEKLKDISNIGDLIKLMSEIKRLENEEITKDSKALLYRKIGEEFLQHDCRREALNNFKRALDNNPKVGVKRLYNKLKKELGK